jgi:hypothetical protein
MSSPVKGSVEGSAQSPADPVHGDADAQQPTLADRTDEAERQRLQHEVVEAAQRMEREAAERVPETAFQLLPNNTVSFRIPVVRRAVERPGRGQTNERVWSALRTEFLTPPQRGWGVPGIAIVAGSIGAVILAAAIALLVANLVQIPPPAVTASGEDEAARNESFSSAAVNLSKIATTQAKMQPADDEPQAAPTGVALATAGPANDIAPAKSPEPLASPAPEIKPAAIESPPPSPSAPPPPSPEASSPPPAAASPPAAALGSGPTVTASQPQPTVTLSQDQIASLMKRSRDLIAAGDVASARLVLTHLADAGVAQASFVLACTFDSSVLANLRVVGVKPDPEKALAWYSLAAEQGSEEAKQHLQALR